MDEIDEALLPIFAEPESTWDSGVAKLCEQHPARASEIHRRYGVLKASGFVAVPEETKRDFPERLGQFQLLERLGSGGMGIVYLARDESLGRTVALKIVRPEHLYFPGIRDRFRREIEAVASLAHPGIVSIFTIGEQHGIPYYAMEVLRGATLDVVLQELAGRTPRRLAGADLARVVATRAKVSVAECGDELFSGTWTECCLRIAHRVALALAHAHSRGVVHRDVKPSNVFVTPEGRVVLLDFGLALAQGTDRLTRSGAQLGSLPYMSPEQVRGETPGAASDLYSLGVTLYEALALRQPYLAPSGEETRRRILTGASPALRTANPTVSWEVETVCTCAREPSIRERYASATDLARDLENVLEHRPILARPASRLRIARRFAQRHPAIVTGSLLGFLLTVGTPTGIALGIAAQRDRAIAAEDEQARRTYYANVTAANAALQADDPGTARLRLEACPESSRGWEWRHLHAALDGSLALLTGHAAAVHAVAFDRSGSVLASGDAAGEIRLWDAHDGNAIGSLPKRERAVSQLAFDHASNLLLVVDEGGVLSSFDWQRRALITSRPPGRPGSRVVLSDGEGPPLVLGGGFDLEELDPRTLQRVREIHLLPVGVPPSDLLTYTKSVLCSASIDRVTVWDLSSGALRMRTKPEFVSGPFRLAVSPDGALLATADGGGRVTVVRTSEPSVIQVLDNKGSIPTCMVFDRSSSLLVCATENGSTNSWDVTSGRLVARLVGHAQAVATVAMSSERWLVASGSHDRRVGLWSAVQSGSTRRLTGHAGYVRRLIASPDGRTLYSACDDGSIRAWDPRTGCVKRSLNHFPHWVVALALDPTGTRLWSSFHSRVLATNAARLEERTPLVVAEHWISYLMLLPNGRHLAACAEDGSAYVIDTTGVEPMRVLKAAKEGARCGAVSSAGDRFWIGGRSGEISVWSTQDYSPLGTLVAQDEPIRALRPSPDGRTLHSAEGQWVRARDARTGAILWERRCTAPATDLILLPNASRLVSGHADGTLVLWDQARGWPIVTLQPSTVPILAVACDPAGSWIASGHTDGTITVLHDSSRARLRDSDDLHREVERSAALYLHHGLRDSHKAKLGVQKAIASRTDMSEGVRKLALEFESHCQSLSWDDLVRHHLAVVCPDHDTSKLRASVAILAEASEESRREKLLNPLADSALALAAYRLGEPQRALDLAAGMLERGNEVVGGTEPILLATRALAAQALGRSELARQASAELESTIARRASPDPEHFALMEEVARTLLGKR